MHSFTILQAPRPSFPLCCYAWKGSVVSSTGGSSGLQKFQGFFPLPCCALPLVVLAISSLVAVAGTGWKSPEVVARLNISLATAIHEYVWFCRAFGIFSRSPCYRAFLWHCWRSLVPWYSPLIILKVYTGAGRLMALLNTKQNSSLLWIAEAFK